MWSWCLRGFRVLLLVWALVLWFFGVRVAVIRAEGFRGWVGLESFGVHGLRV